VTLNPVTGDTLSGKTAPNKTVVVRLPNGTTATTTADANGNWSITIPGASNAASVTITILNENGTPYGTPQTIRPTISNIKVTGVKTLPTLYLVKGKTADLPAAIAPHNATNQGKTWKSSNSGIAKVDTVTGKVKGVKVGKAMLTVTSVDGQKTSQCAVFVVPSPTALRTLAITPVKATSLAAGKRLQVKAKPSPAKATGVVPTFASSKPLVAIIDKAGVITALGKGKTTITVTAGKLKKKFVLTVK